MKTDDEIARIVQEQEAERALEIELDDQEAARSAGMDSEGNMLNAVKGGEPEPKPGKAKNNPFKKKKNNLEE